MNGADLDLMRREHNAAVANGLVLQARRIARRMDAVRHCQTQEESS